MKYLTIGIIFTLILAIALAVSPDMQSAVPGNRQHQRGDPGCHGGGRHRGRHGGGDGSTTTESTADATEAETAAES